MKKDQKLGRIKDGQKDAFQSPLIPSLSLWFKGLTAGDVDLNWGDQVMGQV